jgi:hypothetical protein
MKAYLGIMVYVRMLVSTLARVFLVSSCLRVVIFAINGFETRGSSAQKKMGWDSDKSRRHIMQCRIGKWQVSDLGLCEMFCCLSLLTITKAMGG